MNENVSKRPGYYSNPVLIEAARGILNDVKDWAAPDDLGSDDEIIAALAHAMRSSQDPFEIATELARRYWEPDYALCEVLDGANFFHARDLVVSKWVEENGILPILSIGASVNTPRGEGVIKEIIGKTGEYIVAPPDDPRFAKGGGWLVPFEDAEDATKAFDAIADTDGGISHGNV